MEYYKNTEINDLPGETWRTAPTFNTYQVSNFGRVKSLQKNGTQIIKRQCFNQSYLVIGLSQKGKTKTVRVHRLVADTYLEKPESNEPLEVNHKDRIKTNNCIDNLEWTTHSKNCQDMFATGLRTIKVTPEIVRHIRSLRETGMQVQIIAQNLELSLSLVSDIINGKKWHYI